MELNAFNNNQKTCSFDKILKIVLGLNSPTNKYLGLKLYLNLFIDEFKLE